MILSTAALRSLAQGIQFADPRLYDLLMALIGRLQVQEIDISQISAAIGEELSEEVSANVPPVGHFWYETSLDYLILKWDARNVANYEIRKGTDWNTADRVLVTSLTQAVLDPVVEGAHYYLIKSIDSNGFYSIDPTPLTVTIQSIQAVEITDHVIDNNVLLYWTVPVSTFRISHYNLYRDDAFVGTKDGTFTTYFETLAGVYKYSIRGVDVAGNIGLAAHREVAVKQPPDYVLKANITDDLSGTKTRTYLDVNKLVCNFVPENWNDHFTSRGWSRIQDQIDAGFPYYLQPTASVGEYQQTFDLGVVLTNVILNLTWTTEVIVGSMNVQCQVKTSEDGFTWSSITISPSVFAASVRYIWTKFIFTAGS